MEIKKQTQIFIKSTLKKDTIDTPDCFGEYNKKNKLCSTYCSVSIKCCIMHTNHPKIDILEKLLIHNHYAAKPH